MKKRIHLIAAARPNFMKIAPLYHALKGAAWAEPVIVHTGQHYDINMSDTFFQDLRLPDPDIHLGAGSGSHAEHTGRVMIAYEKVLLETKPDMVVVVGDVNSTIACALAAAKTYFEPAGGAGAGARRRPLIAHLEAGLRSFDRTMPEEINRITTDVLADVLWTPSHDADRNLAREGVDEDKIRMVGNIMIDSLEMMRERIEEREIFRKLGLAPQDYGVVTLHRPANVDDPETLKRLCAALERVSAELTLAFPVHPRTRKNLDRAGLLATLGRNPRIRLLDPMGYISFMNLVFNCRLVITDSGGIQEETTYLGIPCLTLRPNTERPVTVDLGTNRLCTVEDVEQRVHGALARPVGEARVPPLWDGRTADRVVASIRQQLGAVP